MCVLLSLLKYSDNRNNIVYCIIVIMYGGLSSCFKCVCGTDDLTIITIIL